MTAHEVAEHILAKIDEIVQSGDLDKFHAERQGASSIHVYAEKRLTIYANMLDSLTRYAAVEPKEPGKVTSAPFSLYQ